MHSRAILLSSVTITLGVLVSSPVSALSCTDSNWDRTMSKDRSMMRHYNEGVERYEDICTYDFKYNASNYRDRINFLQSRIDEAFALVDYFDITREKLEDVEDRWYALHESCDGVNADSAYDNYEITYDFGKENIFGGEYDVDIVDDTFECINNMKSQIAEMRLEFE
ncbi:hypothetical protein [Vibrio ulleungensis]|uniref:DUF1311 domain-containing protein n=1 Tax=Vibrio ulleungensis TaxID=2807619 RepID=A0ABS2HG16_9VIBR|nr:hypothetical protein [Vibrio ulleungensis]MBM7036483.1 hypothetical protein [Vibrio ulleungensis]